MTRREYRAAHPVAERADEDAPRDIPWRGRLLHPQAPWWPQSERARFFRAMRLLDLDRAGTVSVPLTDRTAPIVKRAWRECLQYWKTNRQPWPLSNASLGVKTGPQ